MSYRGVKRLLGETSLERKCRFLFGACLFSLIAGSFYWYSGKTEEQVARGQPPHGPRHGRYGTPQAPYGQERIETFSRLYPTMGKGSRKSGVPVQLYFSENLRRKARHRTSSNGAC